MAGRNAHHGSAYQGPANPGTAYQASIAFAHRRGLTLIEVVLAAVLLAMVTLTATSMMSLTVGSTARQQKRLAAAELANRLMLIRMDDEENLPGPTETIAYRNDPSLTARQQWRFRWDIEEADSVRLESSDAARGAAGGRNEAFLRLADRLKLVTVRVWLSEASGGSFSFDTEVPNARAVRLVNELSLRNQDSFARRFSGQDGINRLLDTVLEGAERFGGADRDAIQDAINGGGTSGNGGSP